MRKPNGLTGVLKSMFSFATNESNSSSPFKLLGYAIIVPVLATMMAPLMPELPLTPVYGLSLLVGIYALLSLR